MDGAKTEGERFVLGRAFERASSAPPERKPDDPLWRPLRAYTVDTNTPRRVGAVATLNVPYEDLDPGPVSGLFTVSNHDGERHTAYRKADLDDKRVLLAHGYDPSPADPRFHQQMVYAICRTLYRHFQVALGRYLDWGFERVDDAGRLILKPHAFEGANAYYDEVEGSLNFGYCRADDAPTDRTLPQGFVFTCLSHDVIAHEFTHAVLDGLRAQFKEPSGPDVLAFHEAFADLVALFQRFSYPETVLAALSESRGNLEQAALLTELASQLGNATGRMRALRSAIVNDHQTGKPKTYDPSLEAHELGAILVATVFEAFITIFKRKTQRFLRLASHGTGILPPGELPDDLKQLLAESASRLAEQFLNVCIRAVDYCPPVDLRFGEYLRALITADHDLVGEDTWGYREALIEAFVRRRIYPRYVSGLTEDELLWNRPEQSHVIKALSFANLRFNGDPACPAGQEERRRQARVLGEYITRPDNLKIFGLVASGYAALKGDSVDLPCVQSIRSSRRLGPNGQILFDLVAEVTQRRDVRATALHPAFSYHGGATVILDPHGAIRYIISKSVNGYERRDRRLAFLQSPAARSYWCLLDNRYQPKGQLFHLLDGGHV